MKQPERLTHAQYMDTSASYRIFKHAIDRTIDLHWHEFYEMAFVTGGSGSQKLNGTVSRLVPGTLFLLTPADFHEVYPGEGETLRLYNLIFIDRVLSRETISLVFSSQMTYRAELSGEEGASVRQEFDRIWEEAEHPRAGSGQIAAGAIERVLIDLYRACHEDTNPPSSQKNRTAEGAIRDAMIFIQHHFREPITLEQAAASCNLSPNYFSECFHRRTGVPFQSYLVQTRLDFASSLLRVSDVSITEVCMASGFNTLAHFERMFKRRYHCTPRQFRANREILS